ncbi:MAG: hypothetical protein AAFY50_19410 [Cyanobacteria bacterium J06648_1]
MYQATRCSCDRIGSFEVDVLSHVKPLSRVTKPNISLELAVGGNRRFVRRSAACR